MHTKEPWTHKHPNYYADDAEQILGPNNEIIACYIEPDNAILIAQSPAMLRRLESAARWVGKLAADNDTNYIGERAHQELERINAVIAKARGE